MVVPARNPRTRSKIRSSMASGIDEKPTKLVVNEDGKRASPVFVQ